MLNAKIKARIDQKLKKIESLRPLSPIVVEKLKEQFAFEMTFNSNAIEGNKLTLKETYLVINEGITVKGKTLKDHLEAKDHHEAIQYLYELIEHDKRHTLSEHLIRSLQQLIVSDTDPKAAGAYRTGNVMITGAKHSPPDAQDVPKQMRDLILWIQSHSKSMHPIELAAVAHHQLTHIHPFFDGNGRTARLLMNLLLMQQGYPLVIILKNDRKKYYSVLEKADDGDMGPMTTFIAQAVERSLTLYLKAISSAKTPEGRFVPLSTLAKKSSYPEKYLNNLARSGKLEAHKEGRIWVSSVDAVKRYESERLRQHKPKRARKAR